MATRLLPLAVGAMLLAGACSSNPGPVPPSTSPSASPSASVSPAAAPAVKLRRGTARIRVTGSTKGRFALAILGGGASTWQQAPGQVLLRYLNRAANGLIIQGTTPGRPARTSSQLVLSIVIQARRAESFISSRGECRIRIVRSTRRSVSGRFSCGKLTFHGKGIRATGIFNGSV